MMPKRLFVFLIFLVLCATTSVGQINLRGKVSDLVTHEPLANVTILVPKTNQSFATSDSGTFNFELHTKYPITLQFLLHGFLTVEAEITSEDEDVLDIKMENLSTELEGVIIRPKKIRYRNKNNPAVELIRNVAKHKEENRQQLTGPYAQFNSYEKIRVGVTNMPKFITKNPLFKPFRFVFENYDSLIYPGDKTFLMYLDETWYDVYQRKNPSYTKKIARDRKYMSLDPNFINEGKVSENLNYLSQDIDVYDNNFILITNSFKSPIADGGPTFYKYFIVDTVIENGKRFVNLYFTPRNKADLLLNGNLCIAIDDNYAVKSIFMEIDKETNINFVQALHVSLKYEKAENGKFYLKESVNDAQFYPLIKGKRRMTATRIVVNEQPVFPNILSDTLFRDPPKLIPEKFQKQADSFYASIRPVDFTPIEAKTYKNLDSLRKMPYFRNLMDWMSALATGYKNFGLLELGNIYNFYSYNPSEGNRIKLGYRTNPTRARRYFHNAYIAYGTLDRQVKHYAGLTWSIPNQPIYNFPMQYIKMSSQYDVKVPGRILDTKVQDNITENIQRGENNKFIYAYTANIAYNQEFAHNLLLTLDATYFNQKPGGSLYFIQSNNGQLDTLNNLAANQLGVQLRWSPGEKYFNDRTQRSVISSNAPTFILGTYFGFKNILGGDYQFQRFQFEFSKRWFMGTMGILDSKIKANYVLGNLPYPLLNIPKANQTYTFSLQNYNLMNNGEFVSDKQVELLLNYNMYGFILNKIPLIKKLQLREMLGFKMIYGGLSNVNNPDLNPNTMQFPKDATGNSYIYQLSPNMPYMEWNVGIGNIFKLLRIDYVRRISYLDHPNVSPHRIQFSIVYDF